MADYGNIVSRRDMLAVTGTAGAAALAGCFGGDDNGNGNGTDDGSAVNPDQEVVDHADAYFRTADGEHQITDFQYNPHPWAGYSHISFALFAEWTKYLVGQDDYYHTPLRTGTSTMV